MTLTPTHLRQLSHLHVLHDFAADVPDSMIDLQFVTFWEALREEYGLVELLTMLKEYHQAKG